MVNPSIKYNKYEDDERMGSASLRGYKSHIRPDPPIYAKFPEPTQCICTWVFNFTKDRWELKYVWRLCQFHRYVPCMSMIIHKPVS